MAMTEYEQAIRLWDTEEPFRTITSPPTSRESPAWATPCTTP